MAETAERFIPHTETQNRLATRHSSNEFALLLEKPRAFDPRGQARSAFPYNKIAIYLFSTVNQSNDENMHENQLFLGRNKTKKLDFVLFLEKSCIFALSYKRWLFMEGKIL